VSRVLVVDDSSSVRSLIANRLRTQGYTVDEAVDGETGAERALAAPPRHPTPSVPVPPPAELDAVLAQIRKDGFHVGQSTLTPDLRLLAVPVMGADGFATGAISVVAPAAQSSDEDLIARCLGPMQAAARDVARAQEASGSTNP